MEQRDRPASAEPFELSDKMKLDAVLWKIAGILIPVAAVVVVTVDGFIHL
jgi:hypothetical protein